MARIAELGYGCTGAALKIRVLRKWIHHSRQSETWFLAVDKYGGAVQILGRKPNQHLLESKLRLLHCYEIEDYTCTQTRNYLKTILNPIHLNLGLASKITEIEDSEDLPRHWFNFASMERIHLPPSEALDCADVIGSFKGLRVLYKDSGERFLKFNLIHESGQELNITLWSECIDSPEKFNSEFFETTSTKTVFAVTGLKISEYGGQPSLYSTAATYVFRNPVLPETEALIHRLEAGTLIPVNLALTTITLQDLSNLSYSAARGKTFAVRATIDKFVSNEGWFSAFCPLCDTPIPKQGSHWFCVTHGKPKTLTYSFTISAVLDDTTKTFLLIISNDTMNKMCKISCQTIVDELGFDDPQVLPTLIDKCRFGTYTFHIQSTKWSKQDFVQFVVIDVETGAQHEDSPSAFALSQPSFTAAIPPSVTNTETQHEEPSSSLLLTPPSLPVTTPPSATSNLVTNITDKHSSKRKQIIFEDNEEVESTTRNLKPRSLSFSEDDDLDTLNPTKEERSEDE